MTDYTDEEKAIMEAKRREIEEYERQKQNTLPPERQYYVNPQLNRATRRKLRALGRKAKA